MDTFEERIDEARNYYNNEQFHTALDIYKQLYREDPNNLVVINNMVSTYVKICDYNQAIKYADIFLELDSKNANILYSKTVSLINLKRFDEALETIDEVIEINPSDLNSYTFKYKILNALNKEEDKRIFFRDLKNDNPRNFARLMIVLGFLKEQGDLITLKEFDNMSEIKIKDKINEIVEDFSFLYEDIKNPFAIYRQNLFIFFLENLLENNQDLEDVLNFIADNNYEAALVKVDALLDENMDRQTSDDSIELNYEELNKDILIYKAVILFNLNDEKDALNIINKLLKVDKNSLEIYSIRGIIQSSLGNYNNALRSFKKAIAIDDEIPDLWILYIYCLLLNDNPDKAIEENKKALETIPENEALMGMLNEMDIEDK
ncbi:tetratricopeptide repeat protein [Methanobrevibacter sp.]